ncbi:MAG: leukotriene-A4 hydrolase [Patiriisocius sp.]|jgi:leukotriene-A4 hydrolase
MKQILLSAFFISTLISCGDVSQTAKKTEHMSEDHDHQRLDLHSFADPHMAKVDHLDLNIDVNFDTRIISGVATYNVVANKDAKEIIFDVQDLEITNVKANGKDVAFEIKEGNDYGDALHAAIDGSCEKVAITYKTSPSAEAVQWLNPQQTSGKKHPFLFTQGQAILTRTWIPVQDSPGIRISYDATVRVPKELMAVMSASNPQERNASGEYKFSLNKAIPPYLIALAVGDIYFQGLSDRTGVYSEQEMLEKSAYELADMEKMVVAAEGLYGAYAWERFDVIVLPPSFPFGGMENPRLTFATPTIIVGDRSLTSLIAHELAHSWSGNLVTNSTWDDFWLNEGFTVYFEYRIMEEIYGKDYANMLKLLGLQDLKATLADPEMSKEDQHLKLNLKGRNPDDGMTDVAYEKGHLFLEMLENTYGREKFDAFLKNYFTSNAFQNMTTESFVEIMKRDLIDKYPMETAVNYKEWIYGPGLPDNCPKIEADQFSKVSASYKNWIAGEVALSDINSESWSTHEWLHFLREIPKDLPVEKMAALDKAFNLTQSTNAEIQDVWYEKAVYSNYEAAFSSMDSFLQAVGRRKFLTPLYKAMKNSGKLEMAKEIYAKARPNYHSVATNTMDELLGVSEQYMIK